MKDYFNFMADGYLNTSVIFIVLGIIILVIGFFGCCGACTENSCLMTTFAILLTLVVIVQIGLAVAIFMFKGQAHDAITGKMRSGMDNYKGENYTGVTETWNAVQHDFKCCGVDSFSDWKNTTFSGKKDLPDSCCKVESEGCGKDYFTEGTEQIYKEGCFSKLEKLIVGNVELVGGIAIAVLLIQVRIVFQ